MSISAPIPENSINPPQNWGNRRNGRNGSGGVFRNSVTAGTGSSSAATAGVYARAVAVGNITLSGLQTVDTVSLAAEDRVLTPGQTIATDRLIWIVKAGAWQRDTSMYYRPGMAVNVVEGGSGTYRASTWKLETTGLITPGTTSMVWSLDKGTVIDGGVTTAKLADDGVTNAKLRNSAGLSVIGRASNSTGDPADIVAGTDGYALVRIGSTVGFGQILAAGLATGAVTLTKIDPTGAATSQVLTYNGSAIVWADPSAGYTDEQAQDAVGGALLDTSTIDLAYNDATNEISASVINGSIDTPQLATGAVTTAKIADGNVTFAKIVPVATGKLAGRSTAGTGSLEEIAIGAGLSLSSGTLSSTVSAYTDEQAQDAIHAAETVGDTLGNVSHVYNDTANALGHFVVAGGINTNELAGGAVTTAKLDSNAVTTAKIANGAVTLAKMDTDSIGTSNIVDTSVTYAKIQGVSDSVRWLGRYSGGGGTIEEGRFGPTLAVSSGVVDVVPTSEMVFLAVGPGPTGITIPAGATRYLGHTQTTPQSNESDAILYLPRGGTFKNMFIRVSGSQPGVAGVNDLVVMLRVNSADAGVTTTVDGGGSGGSYNDVTNTATGSGGDTFCFKVTNNAASTSITINQIMVCY